VLFYIINLYIIIVIIFSKYRILLLVVDMRSLIKRQTFSVENVIFVRILLLHRGCTEKDTSVSAPAHFETVASGYSKFYSHKKNIEMYFYDIIINQLL